VNEEWTVFYTLNTDFLDIGRVGDLWRIQMVSFVVVTKISILFKSQSKIGTPVGPSLPSCLYSFVIYFLFIVLNKAEILLTWRQPIINQSILIVNFVTKVLLSWDRFTDIDKIQVKFYWLNDVCEICIIPLVNFIATHLHISQSFNMLRFKLFIFQMQCSRALNDICVFWKIYWLLNTTR
jgi:hypothetical protein